MRKINKIKNLCGLLDLASIPQYQNGGQYSAGNLVRSIKRITKREDYLGKPEHNYDFTQSEEWANQHGYYPDERGHRDDRVKKESHPTHPSRGVWKSPYQFDLTDRGVQNVNYTLYGLNDGGQDPQATMTYRGGTVIPEITVTPAGNYIYNSYDNIRIIPEYKEGGIHIKKKNRGKFTKSAKQHGMGVQEYARKVVNDPNATTLQKRRAQFAINAKKFKH